MVKQFLKKILLKVTPNRLIQMYQLKIYNQGDEYLNYSYSQEGEDLLLKRFIGDKKDGFYIDIGAHHPYRFSNTFHFYKKGWKGVNIDAMPGSMTAFKKDRPRDINLEIGVSSEEGELLYYIFNEPALNTFSKQEAEKKDGLRNFKIEKTQKVKTLPLSEILNDCLPDTPNTPTIDFMNIDVEGLDFIVLQSNNWSKYRPNFILIEDLESRLIDKTIQESALYKYLNQLDYQLVAKTFNTLFFKDSTMS